MGKGTIASGGTDGLYQVTLDYGQAARDARVGKVTADLAALVGKIADAQALLDAQQAIEDAQKMVVDAAISAYIAASQAVAPAFEAVNDAQADLAAVQADPFATPEDLAEAQAALTAANDAYADAKAAVEPALKAYTEAATELASVKGQTAALRIPLELLKAEQAQLTKDLATWAALVLTETVPAWCADLTEDATGLVATVEIPGESALVLVAPAAPAPGPADGLLTAREVQSPEQAFWNAAVLPGWQKWKPTYRLGTITALDVEADTASVTLDAATSSAQSLNINQANTLADVPVEYMTCNASAFEIGDACLVQFVGQDQTTPKVVGFKDHPKSCQNVRVITAPFQSVQVYLDPVKDVTDAQMWAGAHAGTAKVYTKDLDGPWTELTLWIPPDGIDNTVLYRDSLGRDMVLIWEPRDYTFDKPVIIIYSPNWLDGAHYGKVVMADGKTAAQWAFNYDGYFVYMRPLKLVDPADLIWTPSLERMRLWET
jgi:hypothetical protein